MAATFQCEYGRLQAQEVISQEAVVLAILNFPHWWRLFRVPSYSGSLIYADGDSAHGRGNLPREPEEGRSENRHAAGDRRPRPSSPSYASLFQERTTFHGIRDFHRTKVPCARAIWAAILAIALSASIHGCYMIVKEYITRPVVVSYVIQEASK